MNRSGKSVSRHGSSDPLRWVSGPWTPWVRGGLVVVASMMVGSVFLLIWHVSREAAIDGRGGVGAVELMVVSDESSSVGGSGTAAGREDSVFGDRLALARYDLGSGRDQIGRTLAKPPVLDMVKVRSAKRELTLDSALRAKREALGSGGRVSAVADGGADGTVAAGGVSTIATDAETPMYNGRPLRKVKTMKMRVTAYSPDERSCGIWADGRTASGYSVWTNGMKLVAADTRLLKFGTIITVPGYHDGKPVPVLDRGGKIKGERLDVLYPSHEIALEWGVQDLDVDVWVYADEAED